MNANESILKRLSIETEGVTKDELIASTGYSESSVRIALAQLTSKRCAVQSKGQYKITEEGRNELAGNPFVTFMAASPKKQESIIHQIFDWDSIQRRESCRSILEHSVEDAPWIDLLAPFVIIYLKAKGIEFPAINEAVAQIDDDEELLVIYETTMNSIGDYLV